jgi:hypothetical protein
MLKRFLIFLFISISSLTFSDESEDFDLSLMNSGYFPCDEGSANEKKLTDLITVFCAKNDLTDVVITGIEDEDEITNSVNIEVRLKADATTDQDLIVFCPLNSQIIRQKYHDVSLSIDIMLKLIVLCKKQKLSKNIIFLFSGANGRDNNLEFYGLKKFISSRPNFNHSFFMVIDLFNEDSPIKFSGSFNKKPLPSQMLHEFIRHKSGYPYIFFDKNDFTKARFNLIKVTDFVTYLLNDNINSISFSNRHSDPHGATIYGKYYHEKLPAYFMDWITTLDKFKFPTDFDYNYNLITFFGKNVIIPETMIIIILLSIIFISIFLRLFLPHLQRLRLSLTLKTIPYLAFLFSIFYLLSFIPFFVFIPLEILTGVKRIFLNFQIPYFFNIFFVPLVLIFVLNELIDKLPFPKHNYIYIFGAVIISFINVIFFLLIDISLVYIPLWVLVMITLSNFTGKKIIFKFFFYLMTPLPLIKLLFDLSLGNADLLRTSFQIPIVQHLVFCIATFPFLLLMMRIRLITRYKYKIYLHRFVFIFILLGTIVLSIVVFVMISVMIHPDKPVIYAKYLSGTGSNTLTLNSNKSIGQINMKIEGKSVSYYLKTDNKDFKLGDIAKPYVLTIKKNKFGANDSYSININSDDEIEYIKINLTTPASFNPLDANYSFRNISEFNKDESKEEKYEFKIPRNPGKEFSLNLFLTPSDQYKISIEIDYPFFTDRSIDITKKDAFIMKYSAFIEEFKL